MTPIEAVIWDWNGTLLDDLLISVDTTDDLLKRLGLPLETIQRHGDVFRQPPSEFERAVRIGMEKEDLPTITAEWFRGYEARWRSATLFDDVRPTIATLSDRGIQQALVSASPHALLVRQTAHFELDVALDAVRGIGHDGAQTKAALIRPWLAQVGVSTSRALVVGDMPTDFEVAVDVGARCVLVPRGHVSQARLEGSGALIVNDMAGVVAYIDAGEISA